MVDNQLHLLESENILDKEKRSVTIMEINRRALYNSLRMNWEMDPKISVEPWQVENYRLVPLNELFERLETHHILIDKASFQNFAEAVESPEELTETLLSDVTPNIETQDQIYLLLFELWRRLLPEKTCLSVFCDEIDHQIYVYDNRQNKTSEQIQDTLSNLQLLLEENCDAGSDPQLAFECINNACANDLECFLLDFITEQIEDGNAPYAAELLEGFTPYVHDIKWFELLQARAIAFTDPEESKEIIDTLVEGIKDDPNLEFNFDLLTFLVVDGNEKTFQFVAKNTVALIDTEEDFQNLLSICIDFYHRLDLELQEKKLQKLLEKRSSHDLNRSFDPKDPTLTDFFKIIT